MSILLLKSMLSIVVVILAVNAMFTMFEVFGRDEKRHDIEKLKRIHKANGILYIILYLFIAYFCLDYILQTRTEPSPRATFHSVFALTVILLLGLKISFVRVYRQFYSQVKTIGLLIALITFGMTGMSGGYYLLATKFGTEPLRKAEANRENPAIARIIVKTDPESIRKGKELYESKCYFCHNAYSTEWIVGPGRMKMCSI